MIRRVLVLETQVPFVHGGAEILVRQTVATLRAHGYETEIVSIPFRDHPREQLLAHAAAWRLIDLSTANARSVDMVLATKFPNYLARHPNKVAWLMHQHRAAYELCGTPFSDFANTEADVGLRDRIVRMDTAALRECVGVFTIARNVSARLEKYNGLSSEPVYHPPKLAGRLKAGQPGDYVLAVTRLERVKRVDLAIETFAQVNRPTRLLIAGTGTELPNLEALVQRLGMTDRITLLGHVTDERLIELYAGALAVLFTPFDEDYGYVTLEAFLSRKPVITASDSGGTLEFVSDGVNGLVAAPSPDALAVAVNTLAGNKRLAMSLGDAGLERARAITWDGVVERLVAAAERRPTSVA